MIIKHADTKISDIHLLGLTELVFIDRSRNQNVSIRWKKVGKICIFLR